MGQPRTVGAGPPDPADALVDAVHRAAQQVGVALLRGRATGSTEDLGPVHRTALQLTYRELVRQLARRHDLPEPPDLMQVPAPIPVPDSAVGAVAFAGVDLPDIDASSLGRSYERALELVPRWRPDGYRLERLRDNGRRASGSYYTPDALVGFLLDQTLEPLLEQACADDDPEGALLAVTVCDPACGSGQFLVPAAHRIADRLARLRSGGAAPSPGLRAAALRDVLVRCVHGVDLDPLAVELTKVALWLQCPQQVSGAELGRQVRCGDAVLGALPDLVSDGVPVDRAAADAWCAEFTDPPHQAPAAGAASRTPQQAAEHWRFCHWSLEFPEVHASGGFRCVVGNPPFLTPLEALTSRAPQVASLLRARCPARLGAYTDTSAILLALSLSLTARGGRVGLVQPQSVLATRDAQGVRAYADEHAALTAFWWSRSSVFSAKVTAVALSFAVAPGPAADPWVRCFEGPDFAPRRPVPRERIARTSSWASLVAERLGVPVPERTPGVGALSAIATVTADFRTEYYGLVGHVHEDGAAPDGVATAPLTTTGLVDPGRVLWGRMSTRFDKRVWAAPVVDLDAVRLSPALARWVGRRLVPKVLVATQGTVLEAAPDPAGQYLPCVPVISVLPGTAADLWRALAVLLAPSTSAWAFHAAAGSALSSTGLKVSARQLGEAPLPRDAAGWQEAAEVLRSGYEDATASVAAQAVQQSAELMTAAYGDDDAMLRWWRERVGGG